MSKLNYDKQQLKNAFDRKLKLVFRTTKEMNGWYILDGKKVLRVTVPKGRGTIPPGTLASIRNQLHLSRDQFDDLIRCPMSAQDYENLIRAKELI